MRWLQSKSQPSTPSSSSFSPVSDHSPPNQNENINNPSNLTIRRNNNSSSGNNDNNNNDKKDLRGPRLTRQKKLRHLRDQDIVGVAKIAHVDMGEWGSQRDNDHSSTALRKSTSMPTPVPLPLPLPLPVPEDNGGRGVEERERDGFRGRVDATGEEVSSSDSPITR